ncbi:MAG TPA: hypothetical protein DCS93_00230 [Microscillaceae bacterium]|nr:hypothetical protein [Microscillaceae bacterium]
MKKLTILLILIPFLFTTCKKKEVLPKSFPQINTLEPVVQSNGVTMFGQVQGFNGETVTDHGFVWSTTNQNPILDSAYSISLGNKSDLTKFEAKVNRGFQQGLRTFYRAFVKTDKNVVYGQREAFSPASGVLHIVNDFYPKQVTWLDTITVQGSYFDLITENNIILLNPDIKVNVHYASDSIIKFVVPDRIADSANNFQLKIGEVTAPSLDPFRLKNATITQVTPASPAINDTVLIEGRYFHPSNILKTFNRVFFDGFEAKVLDANTNEIQAVVPIGLNKATYDIKVQSGELITVTTANLPPVEILDVSPKELNTGEVITITGKNFSPIETNNEVIVGGKKLPVLESSTQFLRCRVYANQGGFNDLKVSFAGQTDSLKNAVFVKNLPNFTDFSPKQAHEGDTIFLDVSSVRVSTGWSESRDYILFGSERASIYLRNGKYFCIVPSMTATQVKPSLYAGLGSYNIQLDEDFTLLPPEINSVEAYSQGLYKLYGKGLGLGTAEMGAYTVNVTSPGVVSIPEFGVSNTNLELGKYKLKFINKAGQSATHIVSISVKQAINVGESFNHLVYHFHFTHNNEGYYLWTNGELKKFNFATETTTSLASFPAVQRSGAGFFKIDDKLYMVSGLSSEGTGYTKEVWEYNITNNTWVQKNNFSGAARRYSIGFSINNKGYVAFGYDGLNWLTDNWEYDQLNDTWTQKNSLGTTFSFQTNTYTDNKNGEVYVSTLNTLRKYNASTDTWQTLFDNPREYYSRFIFEYGGKLYGGTFYNSDASKFRLRQFDESDNTWKDQLILGNFTNYFPKHFRVNNKVYISRDYSSYIYEFNPDPPVKY